MQVPFISITDFMARDQVEAMLAIARRFNGNNKPVRKLGVGVMMSFTSLYEIPSHFFAAFPRNHQIAGIFSNDPLAFNVLHYADYKERDFAKSIETAKNWAGYFLNAIQLDMVWPDTKVLADFREKHPGVQLILQISTNAFDMIEDDPPQLIKKLKTYGRSLDYILLDKSMGRGKLIDANGLKLHLELLSQERPDLGIVVAGGLGPETLHHVQPITEAYPQVSLDAQGKLRPSGNMLDPIDWIMAGLYQERAFALFAK